MKFFFKILFFVIIALGIFFFCIRMFSQKYLLSLTGQGNTQDNLEATSSLMISQKAPFFDLLNLSANRVTLSQFSNTPLVIVFWSTWNQDSVDQVKILDDILSSKNKNISLVSFLAIDSQEDPSVVDAFVKRSGYAVPFALDTYGDVSARYNIKALPTAYFIDRDGIVRDISTGILSQSSIVDKIEQIIK